MRGTISKPVESVTQCTGIWQRYSQSLPITGYDGAPTGCCGTPSDMLIFHSTNTQTLSLLSFAAHVVGSPTTRPSANGLVRCAMTLTAMQKLCGAVTERKKPTCDFGKHLMQPHCSARQLRPCMTGFRPLLSGAQGRASFCHAGEHPLGADFVGRETMQDFCSSKLAPWYKSGHEFVEPCPNRKVLQRT
jgi:hypothetical protein